jgi:hypothetical protein
LHLPLDTRLKEIRDTPYTISFICRKLIQIDNLNELGKDMRPSEKQIWEDTSEELEEWLDEVMKGKVQPNVDIMISDME